MTINFDFSNAKVVRLIKMTYRADIDKNSFFCENLKMCYLKILPYSETQYYI